jgi:hypothetical protein
MSIGWIVLACVFGGALLGMALRLILPEHHLSADSKDVIKLGMGLDLLALFERSACKVHFVRLAPLRTPTSDRSQID